MGYSRAMLAKPVVGIAYTPSGFNNCHRHFPELLDAVKRGVLAAGALPIEFPTISLGEVFLSPTSLKYRNLMSIDTEEMIRAQPMDAVVLMGGCDKTVPAQLMGAVSAGRPAIMLVAGPMMTGRHRGERLGACTDCRRFWARYRAGEVDDGEIPQVEGQLAVTAGTCAVMGTASTMACIAEALGMILPGTAAIPAVHADRLRAAEATGAAAVKLIGSRPHARPHRQRKVGRERVARSAGARRLDQCGHPSHRDRRPRRREGLARSAQRALRFDARAGQSQAGRQRLHGGFLCGRRHGRAAARTQAAAPSRLHDGDRRDAWASVLPPMQLRYVDRSIIAARDKPFEPQGGLVALFGNLAPKGAILKRSAADAQLFEHEGRAVVFSSLADLAARIDDPALDVTPQDMLVLQNAGPHAPECMPEAGYLPIPKKLAQQRRQGHDPRLRRAHERHRLRHDRAACDARFGAPAARSVWCAMATAFACR